MPSIDVVLARTQHTRKITIGRELRGYSDSTSFYVILPSLQYATTYDGGYSFISTRRNFGTFILNVSAGAVEIKAGHERSSEFIKESCVSCLRGDRQTSLDDGTQFQATTAK